MKVYVVNHDHTQGKHEAKTADGEHAKWAVRTEGNEKVTKNFKTQAEAQDYAVELAKHKAEADHNNAHKWSVLVQDRHGKFRTHWEWKAKK